MHISVVEHKARLSATSSLAFEFTRVSGLSVRCQLEEAAGGNAAFPRHFRGIAQENGGTCKKTEA